MLNNWFLTPSGKGTNFLFCITIIIAFVCISLEIVKCY